MIRFLERKSPEFSYAEVSECRLLVDPGKSRRLREISSGKNADFTSITNMPVYEQDDSVDLPPDVLQALQQARRLIDDEVERILSLLPEGRKNSLFKIRFGTLEAIRAREVQAIFKLFNIDYKRAHWHRLNNINYFGEKVS